MFACDRSQTRKSEYITNARQLYDHYQTGQISQIETLGPKMLRLVLKSNAEIKTNRRANVMVAIFVNSLARVEMMRHMDTIEASGGTLFRISCDSLYFSWKMDKSLPFTISEAFGDFKKTHEDVCAFLQVGAASTSTIYREDGELKEDTRVSGLQLNNILGRGVTFSKLSSLLDQAVIEELFNVKSEDFKVDGIRTLHRNLTVSSVRRKQTLSGKKIFERRQVDYTSEYLRTYPFGYRPAES